MRLLITGASGFIGQHLLHALKSLQPEVSPFSVSTLDRNEIDLLSRDASHQIVERLQPTHVLHLAWANTSGAKYDIGNSHSNWADATFSIIRDLSHLGIANWGIGTGLEFEGQDTGLSPYGKAKLDLKSRVLELNDPLCRWISMPYVFSLFHQRPRIVKSCLQGESLRFPHLAHDYLEIRDVANQLMNAVFKNNAHLISITSNRQTSNANFCSRIIEKKDLKPINSCSCLGSNHNDLSRAEDHFTSLLLD